MEAAAAGGRVLLDVPGVTIHPQIGPSSSHQGPLRGRLRVLDGGAEGLVLQWEPLEKPWDPPEETAPPEEEEEPPDPGYEPDWAVLSPPPRPRPPPPGWGGGFRLALGELGGLRRGPPGLRRPFLLLLPRGGPCPPPLHFPRGGPRKLLRLLGPHLRPCPRDPRLLLVTPPTEPPPPPSPSLVTRLLSGPYAATLGGLTRLLGGGRDPPGPERAEPEPEPPFEVISCVTLGPRPTPPRGPPVTEQEWGRSHDAEGRSLDPEGLRERIFRGGLSPEVRPRGWKWLLGLEPPGGDPETLERERRADYLRMKLQWGTISAGQLGRNRPLRRSRERLQQDLSRCCPPIPAPQRALLHDVLMTFCMYHFDLGYVRGMLELLGPLLSIVPQEHEAFWGFCSIMEMVGSNFGPGREGLKRQLGQLGQLVRVLDPNLCERLEERGARGRCRRWLQLRYQRELGRGGTPRVWEVLWTGLPCPNFHLLVACALLEVAGDTPGDTPGDTGDTEQDSDGDTDWELDEDSDRDEGPPGPLLDTEQLLSRAEGLGLQLRGAPDLPPALRELLGLGGPTQDPPLEPLHPKSTGDPPLNVGVLTPTP